MVKAQDFKLQFSWEERQAIVQQKLWYLPENKDSSSFSFPGWDSPDFFGNNKPVRIEYCSGNGTWILEKAHENPHINWVAVEKRFVRARKIWAKIHNQKLPNLVVAWAEGYELTKQFIQSDTIDEIYINFPDPWPKRRHAGLRIVSSPFVKELHRILKPNGFSTIVTDDEDYSKIIIKEMLGYKGFTSIYQEPYFSEPPQEYGSSYFEELFRSKGKLIRFHRFSKAIAS
jgi:tRNA (guanine-N7-)-methyltransferase